MIGRAAAASPHGRPLVVAIGAAAGGLEALEAFCRAVPAKSGLALVVVGPLDARQERVLKALRSSAIGLAVETARDRQPLEAEHVYAVPPGSLPAVEQGQLRLAAAARRGRGGDAVDHLFRSLAEGAGDRSVAIVLSGVGTAGTLGARAVKAAGGLVLAQTPETSAQPGMPASVIASGLADVILPPNDMPQMLRGWSANARVDAAPAPGAEAEAGVDVSGVLAILHSRTGRDFRGYKQAILQRRIARRMGLLRIDSVAGYIDVLRTHPGEVDRVSRDLLIGVTAFFRDAPAFDELATIVRGLIQGRDQSTPIRVWVPGCATGAEAYSIAIIVAEQIAAARSACRVQIFATDLDEQALERARLGSYPESIALDVAPERLQRFFTRADHRYTIAASIRQSVAFVVQDLTRDPPFSKLDLVSCRNLLIYFEPEQQQRVLSKFHFALKPGGYLFLGGTESVQPQDGLFVPDSRRYAIFRRAGQGPRRSLVPWVSAPTPAHPSPPATKILPEPTMAALADEALLGHLSPAAVVVRSTGQILRFYGAMRRYLEVAGGAGMRDLVTLARDPLKAPLRDALREAVRLNRETVIETSDRRRRTRLRVTVKPLDVRVGEPLWLMLFEDIGPASRRGTRATVRVSADDMRRLDAELRAVQAEQQHLAEQLEARTQELGAAQEEALSVKQALQLANEELVTSEEELQSTNQELNTLNAQLTDRVHELTALNDDLAILLVSTDIATVFLDGELRIKRFTTAASHLLNLRQSDTGRPFSHLATTLAGVDLAAEARTVLTTAAALEKEVNARNGSQYLLRILPYRARAQSVEGVILTLVDLTALKQTERELRTARERVADDLRRMTRLHELSAQTVGPLDGRALLEHVVRAAVEITGAAMGDVQQCDGAGALTLAAHGLPPAFLEFFAQAGACGHGFSAAAATTRQRVLVEDITISPVVADARALGVMVEAGVRAVQSTPLFDRSGQFVGVFSTYYRDVHHFDIAELRWIDLLARHAADLIERQRAEELLARSRTDLEARVADRTRWLSLMHDVARAINEAATWEDALHRVLRRLCQTEHWQVGFVYVPQPGPAGRIGPVVSCFEEERFRPFHELSMERTYAHDEPLPGRVYAQDEPFWALDSETLTAAMPVRADAAVAAGLRAAAALPVTVRGEVVAVLEIFSDQPHPRDDQLAALMHDVGDQIGRILEREQAIAHTAELVWRERQELLHTLHDSLGQTLTAVGMLSTGLRQRLSPADTGAAETAAEIARQAQQALDQVRLLARSLFPLEVDAESLVMALRDLAAATQSLHKLRVRVEAGPTAALRDGKIATELYRIAQEAVTNSVKHARAETITIRLHGLGRLTRLQVVDDGIGVAPDEPRNGMGLRIMRHRAAVIGASLSIERGLPGGTIVTCTLRKPPGAGVQV